MAQQQINCLTPPGTLVRHKKRTGVLWGCKKNLVTAVVRFEPGKNTLVPLRDLRNIHH